jgi:hypothetical protein
MVRKFLVAAASAAALVSAAGNADAALIIFNNPTFPEISTTTFVDGVFGSDLGPGGFFRSGVNSAISYSGLTNEYIRFNAPVTLNSLTIGPCGFCGLTGPISFNINLYNVSSVLISSTLVNASSTPEVVDLDQSGVEKVEFSFAGEPGTKAWYEVSDVSYDRGQGVPEPAIWSMMISGFGLIGAGLRRHRSRMA